MTSTRSVFLFASLAICGLSSEAAAHRYTLGALTLDHPWSRETATGQSAGGGFVTIVNKGAQADTLVSGSTPVAAEVQLHSMTMDGGIMRMRQLPSGIAIPAKGTVALKPGGLHIMFMGLKRPLKDGERIPVTLRFQRAGTVKVEFAVQAVTKAAPAGGDHAHH